MSIEPLAFHVAIVGGGITGACVASMLRSASIHLLGRQNLLQPIAERRNDPNFQGIDIQIDIFDQGRSGVGGRSSHRIRRPSDAIGNLAFDHGCQFFRADTKRMQEITQSWINHGTAREWNAQFASTSKNTESDFFGLPSSPPFYIGTNGIQTIPRQIIEAGTDADDSIIKVHEGTRVASIKKTDDKWTLYGVSGDPAYHDTTEKTAKQASNIELGTGYDAVILTDVSSSFDQWHRASAGVPSTFAEKVKQRVGARIPLFTAMVAYDKILKVPVDAITFEDEDLWFAARSSSKGINVDKDCWTLVSTPEYALKKIEETPMRDAKTGAFIPQSPDYLQAVPGKDLTAAFEKCMERQFTGVEVPSKVFIDAQRWGSALPHGWASKIGANTNKTILGTEYNTGSSSFFPTRKQNGDAHSYIADDDIQLYQAGDMVSGFTPGFEGAVLSAIDLSNHLIEKFEKGRSNQ